MKRWLRVNNECAGTAPNDDAADGEQARWVLLCVLSHLFVAQPTASRRVCPASLRVLSFVAQCSTLSKPTRAVRMRPMTTNACQHGSSPHGQSVARGTERKGPSSSCRRGHAPSDTRSEARGSARSSEGAAPPFTQSTRRSRRGTRDQGRWLSIDAEELRHCCIARGAATDCLRRRNCLSAASMRAARVSAAARLAVVARSWLGVGGVEKSLVASHANAHRQLHCAAGCITPLQLDLPALDRLPSEGVQLARGSNPGRTGTTVHASTTISQSHPADPSYEQAEARTLVVEIGGAERALAVLAPQRSKRQRGAYVRVVVRPPSKPHAPELPSLRWWCRLLRRGVGTSNHVASHAS